MYAWETYAVPYTDGRRDIGICIIIYRVVSGYGLVQPLDGPTLQLTEQRFQNIYSVSIFSVWNTYIMQITWKVIVLIVIMIYSVLNIDFW